MKNEEVNNMKIYHNYDSLLDNVTPALLGGFYVPHYSQERYLLQRHS